MTAGVIHTILSTDSPPAATGRHPGDMFVHPAGDITHYARSRDGACSCRCESCGQFGFLHEWRDYGDGGRPVMERRCPDLDAMRRDGLTPLPVPERTEP